MSPPTEDPPIARSPMPHRAIDIHEVVEQPSDDVLLICTGIVIRVAATIWTIFVCVFGVLFILPLVEGPLAWLAIAVFVVHVLLLAGVFLLAPVRFDRISGTVGRGGIVPGGWERDLTEVLAVQICLGKCDVTHGDRARETRVRLQYQLNLVFNDSPPSRRNVCQEFDLHRIQQVARNISEFLDVPTLDYVGWSPGTPSIVARTDAKASRLLDTRGSST